MREKPTLTVIVCNYNHAQYLTEALAAIVGQSYQPLEVIVIDDGSTDNSLEVIQEFERNNPIIRLYRNDKNEGIFFSIKRAINLAVGDFVYWAAADDRVLPGLFEKSMRLLADYPMAGVCSSLIRRIGSNGEDKGWIKTPLISSAPVFLPPEQVRSTMINYGFWFTGQTIFLRREFLLNDTDGYLPSLAHRSDHFVDMVLALKAGACFIPEILATYRIMDSGYAEMSFDDENLTRKTLANQIELMRSSKYAPLFTEKFTKTWESRALHELEVRSLLRHHANQKEFLHRLRAIGTNPTLLNNVFLLCISTSSALWKLMARLYLLHGQFDWNFRWFAMRMKMHFARFS